MITASCHCGALQMEIDAPPPAILTDCSCSICRRTGALWVYYSPKQVRLIPPTGATSIYMWSSKSIEFHTCKVCACATHWEPADKTYNRMGVNARMMEPETIAGANIEKITGPP